MRVRRHLALFTSGCKYSGWDRRSQDLRDRVSELVRSDVKPERTIYRGTDTAWKKSDLVPGRYRLTALAAVDESGREERLPNQDSERFRLRASESVTATIVLKRPPLGAIAGISAGVAGAILLAIALAAAAVLAPQTEAVIAADSQPKAGEVSAPIADPAR